MEMGFVFVFCLFCFLFCCLFCFLLVLFLFCCSAFLLFVLKVSRYKTWEIHSFILISDFACLVMLPIEMHSSFLIQALTKESPGKITSLGILL